MKQRLFSTLARIKDNSKEQVLIVQTNLIKDLDRLTKFTELTNATGVQNIVTLDDHVSKNIARIEDAQLVVLLDVRMDLVAPATLKQLLSDNPTKTFQILFYCWKTQKSNILLSQGTDSQSPGYISHYIASQLPTNCSLIPLYTVPSPYWDEDVLITHQLFNLEGWNMYYPKLPSMQIATRELLTDNIVCCLQWIIQESDIIITNVVAFGPESAKIADSLKSRIEVNRTSEEKALIDGLYGNDDNNYPVNTDLIIMERGMDPLTPLLTNLTYAGLINETYDSDSGFEIGNGDELIRVNLDSSQDNIWDQLKFLNFGAIGPRLNQLANNLQEQYDSRHEAETVGEIKKFVESLSSLQERQKLLKMHTTLSSSILEKVEDSKSLQFNRILEFEQDILSGSIDLRATLDELTSLIYENDCDVIQILALACIHSLTKQALRDKDYESLQRDLVDAYGFSICAQLDRLDEGRLFTATKPDSIQDTQSFSLLRRDYRTISRIMNTMPQEEGDGGVPETPRDASFAYCGVVPLSTRLIQSLYDSSSLHQQNVAQLPFSISRDARPAGLEDAVTQIYGPDALRQESWTALKRKSSRKSKQIRIRTDKSDADTSIIVYVGGVTAGEIATIKFIEQSLKKSGINRRFLIVADGIINKERLLRSLNYNI